MSEDQNEVRPLLSASKNDVEDGLETPQIDDGGCTTSVDTEMLCNVTRLAVPAALTCLLTNAHKVIAVAMFAHTNSDDLAIVAMFLSVHNFIGHALVSGLCSGFDTMAPRAFGAGDHLQVGILVQRTLAVILCCGWTTQCVLSIFMSLILTEIGVDTAVASRVGVMMRWYCLASPFAALQLVLGKMFHAMRKMQPGLITQAVTTVGCSVMLGLLVFKWEIGYMAGLYFMLAEATIKCVCYCIFVYFDPDVSKCFTDGITISQAFTEWGVYLHLAIPGLLMQGWWAWEMCSILAATVSNSTVGAWAVSAQLLESARFISKGLGRAFTTMLGNAIGAKSVVVVHRIMRAGVVTMIVGAPLHTLALGLLFKFAILALTSDGNVEQKSVEALFFILGFTFLDFVQPVLTAFIVGLGLQAKIGYMSTLISCLVGVPLCVVFVRVAYLGVSGIWLGLCCSYFLIDLLYAVGTWKFDWESLHIAEVSEHEAKPAARPILINRIGSKPDTQL